MLMVFFSWILIAGAALIFGKTITDALYRNRLYIMGRPDIYIMTGIIFLNIYAQFFSLFFKVSGIACMFLGAVGIAVAVIYVYKWFRIGGGVERLVPGALKGKNGPLAVGGFLPLLFAYHGMGYQETCSV